MIKVDEYTYKAEEGKFILRKSDNFIMGEEICLGSADDISNYKEKAYTKRGYKTFYESIGINIDEKEKRVPKAKSETKTKTTKKKK